MFHSKQDDDNDVDDQTVGNVGEEMVVDLNWHRFPGPEERERQSMFPPASVELLRKAAERTPSVSAWEQEPCSLPDIIRSAAAAFVNSSGRPFHLVPSNDDQGVTKQVQLVHCLLRAAEQVGREEYEHAICLLELVDSLSSRTGDLTQRVVHYFAQALRERAHNKSGVQLLSLIKELEKVNVEEVITAPSPIVAVIYAKIPFYQVAQLAGVQAIVESVGKSKRIHIIDLRIRNGMQWTALIQALTSPRKRALEILKITAIVNPASESSAHETGERLAMFAKSMNIPFAFKAVMVLNMLEIEEKQFEIDRQEGLAIFCEYALQGLLPKPKHLEALMVAIRNIRPALMVVIETEANLNSINFAHRFVEVLFHYGAHFDCVDTCLDSDDANKVIMESIFLKEQVNGVLVKDDSEMTRTVTIDVWRKFFSRFWMVETSLSPTAMDTVNLLLTRFSGGSSCTVDINGRSMVVGWKGIPVFSLSTWKFLVAKPLKQTIKKSDQINIPPTGITQIYSSSPLQK